jgi:3'(2'), 5'-bisphosphate nucleotidase
MTDGNLETMWNKSRLITQLVSASVASGKKAGEIIRKTIGTDLQIIRKTGAKDLQTEADRRAQMSIVASLQNKFGKDLCIIGEEDEYKLSTDVPPDYIETNVDKDVLSYDSKCPDLLKDADKRDIVVWVDPLDGTSEFTEGLLDHVTVLIGIALRGTAVAGVIHQPFYGYDHLPVEKWGRTLWAIEGVGAFGLTPTKPSSDKRIITTTRSHSDKLVNDAIQAVEPDEVLRVGGAGHKVMIVIEGRAHAYVFASKGCRKWDTCAPEAVLKALGGHLTDLHGNQIRYHQGVQQQNSGGVLATPPSVDHKWFIDHIPQNVKDALPPLLA